MTKRDIWSLYGLLNVDDLGRQKRSKAPKLFWPEQFLPLDVPTSRIFTWGFESDIEKFFEASDDKNTPTWLGDGLLDVVLDHNWRGNCPDRPTIFVAHSLGGSIVKKVRNLIFILGFANSMSGTDAIKRRQSTSKHKFTSRLHNRSAIPRNTTPWWEQRNSRHHHQNHECKWHTYLTIYHEASHQTAQENRLG
jgi:hypothetical protein